MYIKKEDNYIYIQIIRTQVEQIFLNPILHGEGA